MISNEFLEFILAAENLLVEGLGISDRLGIHLIASLGCKLIKLGLLLISHFALHFSVFFTRRLWTQVST